MKEEKLEINGNNYKLKIHIDRRRYSRASVSRNSINIRIPFFLIGLDRDSEIDKLKKWAIGKILSNPERFSSPKQAAYENGQKIKIAGKEYALSIREETRAKVFAKIFDNEIEIRIPMGKKSHIGKILPKLISREFLPFATERARALNKIYFQKPLGRISLKNNKSTWGSCASNGNITLATKLLLAPADIIDYVIIHELAHLVVRGHSKKFWQVVGKALPDYREKRKWLRKNGDSCRF